ncbi:alpha/beta hydrolase [Microbacterium sp. W1N]|uniref:alpha/beta fold hydrolase n=1 Tax=Microbacterium festucae TaxID=2977531 RepID=UPI0021BE071B|nr:alpha/beta hydrolase [Microbacterium festucae]MCT9819586.1 alpha/beta hydrolase [Microbacterium festucae]
MFRDEAGRRRFARAYEAAMAELPPPTATRMLPTAFGQVRAYVWEGRRADAVPVVLHPGRGAGAPMWADNLPGLLGAGRTVVAWDAFGDAGMSQQSAALRSAADQAAWVDDALDALGMAVVHVVGHSFGAATAARHASAPCCLWSGSRRRWSLPSGASGRDEPLQVASV